MSSEQEFRGQETRFHQILEHIRRSAPSFASRYLPTEDLEDILFQAEYKHVGQIAPMTDDRDEEINDDDEGEFEEEDDILGCQNCDRAKIIKRKARKEDKRKIHYGPIAIGNQVIRDAGKRDEINRGLGGNVLCFEMEAAGIANSHPCLVIRCISDYADSHKNHKWRKYAAVVAAAFAREFLEFLPPEHIIDMQPAAELMGVVMQTKRTIELNLEATNKIDMEFALTKLPSVNEAAFDSFANQAEPLCHPETRIELLIEINDWALNPQSKCIFWLNGMAGTGKSTISRTVAREFFHRRQLGASFFFKRGEGDRGNATKFFTTIATQLMQSFPDLRSHLKEALETCPAISTKTMKEQFEKLIFEPLSALVRPFETLLVIDALDECQNEGHISMILHLLARVQQIESAKLRLLVTSRPDLPVRLGFRKIPESHRDFILHNVPPPIIKHDIHVFLRDELPKIRDNCEPSLSDGIPSNWPTERNTEALANMAVPLFIFAATMCRFIGDIWDWDPVGKLAKILFYRSFESLTQLETTYLPVLNQILQGSSTKSEKDGRIQEFRNIVGSIILLFEPLSRASLAVLLGISRTNIDCRLHTLHSVLRVPADPGIPVRLFHLSFRDFLIESENSQNEFRIDEKEAHKKLAFCCLDLLLNTTSLKEDICSLKKPGMLRLDIDRQLIEEYLPSELQYACRYWAHHLASGHCQISDRDKIHKFLDQRFLYWIEALSIIGRIADSISTIANLQGLLISDDTFILKPFLNDAKRFLLKNREILDIAPLQLYSCAIVFAPETSLIRNSFKDHIPAWLRRLPIVDKAWDAELQILGENLTAIYSLALSSDGRLLALADERDIEIWDAITGDLQLSIECSSEICSVAFSPHGNSLALACESGIIKIRDAVTGDLQQHLEGHSDSVFSVAYHGELLASGSCDKTIKIWDSITGSLRSTFEGHSAKVLSVAFSPNGNSLASACESGIIEIRDAVKGDLQQSLKGHLGSVHSLAFASHGNLLASGSKDNTVRIWNPNTGDLHSILKGHSRMVISVAFAPDNESLASASEDATIKIWNAATGERQQTLRGPDCMDPVAFLPSGLLISSWEGKIKIWDISMKHTEEAHEEESSHIQAISFSPNGKMIALGYANGRIQLWSTVTKDIQHTINSDSGLIQCMTFSPDNTSIVCAFSHPNKTIKFWDIAEGNLQGTIDEKDVEALAFSPDGNVLAIGYSNRLSFLDLTSRIIRQTFNSGCVTFSITFSSNGKLLASGTEDGIMIWNVSTGELQQTEEVDGIVFNLWFHPEKPELLSDRGTIMIQGDQTSVSRQPCQRDYVFRVDNWITWNKERVLWVPSEYHYKWDCMGKMLAIGHKSGLFSLIEIDFSKP